MEVKKLKEIAKISLGYSFRGKIKHEKDGNMLVVNAKNIKDNFILSGKSDLIKINHPIYEDRLIQKGDIVLSNRSYFQAAIFDLNEKAIGASSIYILKANKKNIFPEYLAIWINSKKGQNQINRNVTGSMIKTILRSDLENLKIDIPSLEKQKKIVELYKIQIELQNKLEKKKSIIENIFQETLSKTINK